jgi:hypothetical protein
VQTILADAAMPHHFEFEPVHRVLLLVLEGNMADEEMLQTDIEIRTLIGNLSPSSGITDASSVTSFNVSSHTIRALARRSTPYHHGAPRFLVAPTDYLFGMARMYQISGDRERMQVVRSLDEALAALGVENPKFEKLAQPNVDRLE